MTYSARAVEEHRFGHGTRRTQVGRHSCRRCGGLLAPHWCGRERYSRCLQEDTSGVIRAGGAVMACLILRFTRTLGTARLPSWAETCEVNTAKLVCNLAGRKPWPHPKGTGAAELGKHPVEIGHDEIEVRFAPMSRRLGVDPDVHPELYFPAYFGNSAQ